MANQSIIRGVVANRCPNCHQGACFKTDNPYKLSQAYQMHAHCPHCGQNFEPETGFYFGSMYISYGLSLIVTMIAFFGFAIGLDADPIRVFIVLSVILLALHPVFFRLSRLIWLHIFVKYNL
jgi:hypothetical protein